MAATVTADAAGLDNVHELIERFWHEHDAGSDGDRIAVTIALGEIAGNVVRHGVGAPFAVSLRRADAAVVAVVDEPGPALPADVVTACGLPDDDAESGRGLALARAAVDELTYERVDDHNRWTVRRRVVP